jgi:hypothetical protein
MTYCQVKKKQVLRCAQDDTIFDRYFIDKILAANDFVEEVH